MELLRKNSLCAVYQKVLIAVISVALQQDRAVDISGADLYSLGVLTWVDLTKFGTPFSIVIPLNFSKFHSFSK